MKEILDNPNPKPRMNVRCKFCDCKFRFTAEDVRLERRFVTETVWDKVYITSCPNCGKELELEGYENNKKS